MGGFKKIAIIFISVLFATNLLVGCDNNAKADWRHVDSKTINNVPVPNIAEEISKQSLGGAKDKTWTRAYSTNKMTMPDAAKWYESKLKNTDFKIEKLPEKPTIEGYTIFLLEKEGEHIRAVIVNDKKNNKINIQITGEDR